MCGRKAAEDSKTSGHSLIEGGRERESGVGIL